MRMAIVFTEAVQLNSKVLGAKAFYKSSQQSKLTADFSWVDEYRQGEVIG